MKLAIICAMDEELAAINNILNLSPTQQLTKAGNTYSVYEYGLHTLVTVVSGIGKVNAAVTTQTLLNHFTVDAVINVGVAGSLIPELSFGDVVIADDLVEHDFDITAFGVPLGQIARMDTFSFIADSKLNDILKTVELTGHNVRCGRIVSGDQFIDSADRAKFLHSEFNALACEMEGAAIAHVCYLNQMPFAVVRSLSDMAGQDNKGVHSFNELKDMAASRAALVVKYLMENI